METDKNIMPELTLFPRLEKVASFIKRVLPEPEINDRGASDMLDRMLYDLPPYQPQPKQLEIPYE